jgi:hypothetical protein
MNNDIAQLVRESIDQLTDGATVPPDLATRARRLHRRRNVTIGSAMTATAAAAAVIAVAAGLTAAPARSGTGTASLDAAVVTNVERALAGRSGDVVQASLTGAYNHQLSWSDSVGSRTTSGVAVECKIPPGATAKCRSISRGPEQYLGYVLSRGKVTFVTINIQAKTWQQTTLPDSKLSAATVDMFPLQTIFRVQLQAVTRGCPGTRVSPVKLLEFSWPAFIRQMLGCGAFKVAGHGTVGGVRATKLVATGLVHVPYFAVLWVGRSSYLPLRLEFVPLNRSAGPVGSQIDLRWLPATRANLVKAAILPAPAGFKQLPWR